MGSIYPSGAGTTVRYVGAVEARAVDVDPVLEFVIQVGAGVTATMIAGWLIDRFRGPTKRITVNHREVDLDDKGQVRKVVEDEITVERP